MYKSSREIKAHEAKPIANPVPRPERVMIRMVADTTTGVHATCGEHTGSYSDLICVIETMLGMGDFVRSVHIYIPEGGAINACK